MDYKDIKKIMDDMEKSKLSELELEFPDGVKIKIKKDEKPKMPPIPLYEPRTSMVPLEYGMPYQMQAEVPAVKNVNNAEEKQEGNNVKAPMVGTFYSKSSPTSEPFVKVGSKVKKGDTLCIIEAMKLMNEIESEFDGEVVEILAKDGEMVDYGKTLFVIK